MNNESKHDVLDRRKYPTSNHKYVGIEIEFITKIDENIIRNLLIKYDLHYNCKLGEDGSIQTREHRAMVRKKGWDGNFYTDLAPRTIFAYELRILCEETEMSGVLERVGIVMEKIKAYTNDTCGLHVHLDMRNRDVKKCFANLFHMQKFLFSIVSPDRKQNQFCRMVKGLSGGKTHYAAISRDAYTKYSTLEVRMHHGETDVKEVHSWVKLLQSIVDNKTPLETTSTWKDLTLDKQTILWLSQRINKKW